MESSRALALGITSLPAWAVARVEAALGHAVEWRADERVPEAPAELADVTTLLVSLAVRVDARVIDALPRLRHIAVYGTSTSRIDTAAALRAGILVTNVQRYCDEETAEFALALLLSGVRGLLGDLSVEPTSFAGLTLGVIGLGQVGAIVAELAPRMGATVERVGRPGDGRGGRLDQLSRCQLLSLHGPRGVEIVGRAEFEVLPKGVGIVNTCNGPAMERGALERWLARDRGWLALDRVAARTYGDLARRHPRRVFASERAAFETPQATSRRASVFAATIEEVASRRR